MALPVVSTNVSAIPELVTDGRTGLLVPPQDSAALATALERLIQNPAERLRLGAAGRARVLSDFGPDTGIDSLAARFGVRADARAA